MRTRCWPREGHVCVAGGRGPLGCVLQAGARGLPVWPGGHVALPAHPPTRTEGVKRPAHTAQIDLELLAAADVEVCPMQAGVAGS